ncbi:MAG TPA: hypothetical protein GXX40_04785 [Firmicutes bacterium]|nr:hypothetical protein [Bacillota bacterium]
MAAVLVWAGIVALGTYVRARKLTVRQRSEETAPKESPYSVALKSMIGIAGGLYISLVALTSFLGMEVPARVILLGVSVDPLAVASLLLALVQSFFPLPSQG